VLPLDADALFVSLAEFALLELFALFLDAASVAANDRFELFEAELVSVDPWLLLALSVSAALLDALVLKVAFLLVVKLSVLDSVLFVVWLDEELRLCEELLVSDSL
jgi:hypothetical protein